ncbi:MAG TPA: alpha/beta fold hydrolase [Pseudonocardiaceae bacterium]|jgi:pimeloyl-ACP methyl ester carboxylesterase|nr:alpha/beta fold hydrolase [Pseudonocardiaceae bacterium]
MTVLRSTAAPARPLLTRVPLSTDPLPPLADPIDPWPGREVRLRGKTLYLRETPGPDDGVPAVYVHGLGGSATNWTELAGQLAGRSPGVAVDLPGFGRSRPHSRARQELTDLADIVVGVITEVAGGGPVHLVGNSMGGAISLLVAAGRPDLVRTLTLISPAVPDLRPSVRRLSDPRLPLAYLPVIGRRARRAIAATSSAERADQMLRLCFAEPDKVSQSRIDLAIEEFEERVGQPWAGPALGMATTSLFRAWMTFGRGSLWAVARRVLAPALVVWGAQDRLVSVRKAPRTASALPNARLLVLPNTGHVAMMERPATVARATLSMWEAAATGEW